MSLDWRIYYADGSTFDGAVEDAPGLGVVVIPQSDPEVGRMMMARWDYYCWHGTPEGEGQWWGHDLTGLVLCLAKPGWSRVLVGETVSQADYQAIWSRAEVDPDFAPRSASLPMEER